MKKITFRHMDPTPDVKNYAEDALARVEAALEHERSPIYIDLILEPGRPHAHHSVELIIKTPNHNIICREEGPHFFQLLDIACDLAYRKIHEQKERMNDELKKADSYKGV